MEKARYFGYIIIVFLLDQLSKILIVDNFGNSGSVKVISNFFYITYSKNQGAAFGMFHNKTFLIVIMSLGILAYLLFELFCHKKKNRFIDMGTSLLIGGLLGNLFDRLYFGYVRDFLDFKIFHYDFAIFNIADVSIVVGVFIFLIGIILEDRYGNSSKSI